MDGTLTNGSNKVTDARGKIEEAEKNLEDAKKSKKITDEEYQKRTERISQAKAKADELEKQVKKYGSDD